MLKNITCLAILLFCIFSNAQRFDSIRFENISQNTSAKDLFIKYIVSKDDNIYTDKNGNEYNAVEAFENFNTSIYATLYDIRFKEDELENPEYLGRMYTIDRYKESENVFSYEKLSFYRFTLYTNKEDKIIALKATNENENLNNLNEFISEYSQKYKTDFFKSHVKKYYFHLDNKTLKLKIGDSDDNASPSIGPSNTNTPNDITEKIKIEFVLIFNDLTQYEKDYLYYHLHFQDINS